MNKKYHIQISIAVLFIFCAGELPAHAVWGINAICNQIAKHEVNKKLGNGKKGSGGGGGGGKTGPTLPFTNPNLCAAAALAAQLTCAAAVKDKLDNTTGCGGVSAQTCMNDCGPVNSAVYSDCTSGKPLPSGS